MFDIIDKFVEKVRQRKVEIYNEYSLQHELGFMIRQYFPNKKVQFERNISYFFGKSAQTSSFIKKEIDIAVFSEDKSELQYAIELKYPRNGQHPEQMFSFCKDIVFAEQMKEAGFERALLIILAEDPLFYRGNEDGIYGFFRGNKQLTGTIQKPTGKRDEWVRIKGSYQIKWNDISKTLKYSIVDAT